MIFLSKLPSLFSRVRLCVTPQMAAHQAPPSLGFSRQEHWSGLPFPSPMQESEKWKRSRSVVFDPQRPHRLQPTRLLRPWDFPGKSTGVGCHCLLRLSKLTGIFLIFTASNDAECNDYYHSSVPWPWLVLKHQQFYWILLLHHQYKCQHYENIK